MDGGGDGGKREGEVWNMVTFLTKKFQTWMNFPTDKDVQYC